MSWRRNLDGRTVDTNILWFQIAATVVVLALLFAFWEIQVRNNAQYSAQAERNRIKTLPIRAARGNILDRRRRVLAQSRLALTAIIDLQGTGPGNLPRIAQGLGLDLEQVRERVRDAEEFGNSEYVVLKENLSVSELAFLEARRSELREIHLIETMQRQYAETGVAVHAVGYVGEVSKSELNQREFLLHRYGAEVGKSGIERQYDDWLAGRNGSLQILVDSRGRQLEILGQIEPVPGNNLQLTLDLDLQAVAELGLEGRKGSVVALDPRNGEVLAMASSPVYDPNKFVAGLAGREWVALNADPATPMLNRAIQGTWAPGSVYKPIIALAGLEHGLAGDDFQAHCRGGLGFGGHYFRCHKRGGHGTVRLQQAIAQSCDVYFYLLGHKLGVDTQAEYSLRAGLGRKTNIDLPNELTGLVPTVEWKVREFRESWQPGDTIVVSIGQGALTATPLQLAHAIGGLAVGGVWRQPRLVSDGQLEQVRPGMRPPPPRREPLAPEHRAILREAMWTVVNGAGTGGQARLADIDVCGKTGTSQRVSDQLRRAANRPEFEDDALFVGYAPCAEPEIVVAVLLENRKASYYAAALARDVLQAWLLTRRAGEPADLDGALAWGGPAGG